jgi:periplasmic divalent cation tolerance protein
MIEPIVVLITVPSKDMGKQIARALLEQKLAACVNIISPLDSMYTWEGKICTDEEVLLVVKSRAELFENQLVPAVQAIHTYQVPEIIALPIKMGAKSYLDWIEAVTKRT